MFQKGISNRYFTKGLDDFFQLVMLVNKKRHARMREPLNRYFYFIFVLNLREPYYPDNGVSAGADINKMKYVKLKTCL